MAGKLPAFRDDALYKIKIGQRAEYKDTVFKPGNGYTVKGKVAKLIRDAISEAEAV